jgi:type I restriction enzyme S subunit
MYGASIGKTAIAGVHMTTNQAIAFTNPEPMPPRYLLYYLQAVKEQFVALGQGGAQPNISQTIIRDFPFPVAPINEQHRIVAEVETQFTRLDAAVAALERSRANLKRYKAAFMDRLLWDNASSETTSLGDVADLKPGFAFRSADWTASGTPVIRISSVQDGRVDLSDCTFVGEAVAARSQDFALQKGDVLIALTGDVGDVARVPEDGWLLNQRVARLRVIDGNQCEPQWLFYLLLSNRSRRNIEAMAKGMAQPNVSPKDVRELTLPLVAPEEQHRIVAEVERRLSVVEELEKTIDANLKRAERLRQAILARAFAGKLVPQDPTDEPASVLLERIRAEQSTQVKTATRMRRRSADQFRLL